MSNAIKLKRGSGSDPSASDLVVGEIAIRTDNGKLFTKKDNGSVAEISGSGGGNNFLINTLSSSSGSGGGSASFNGTATRFELSNAPNVAAQLLVSINGVIQKPNTGTSPSEGFAVDGNDIIFASAPANGASFFIVTYASLALAEPSDNSVTSAKIVDGAIVNADINASAAIDVSKLSGVLPLAGGTLTGTLTIGNAAPNILFTDSDHNPDFGILASSGIFRIQDTTNTNNLMTLDSSKIQAVVNLDCLNGLDVTGNISVSGTVDGRDVATDGTKLDGIESGATADQSASEIVALIADQTIAPSTIDMEDNEKIKLGTDDDLEIYFNGANSIIDSNTGNLEITADSFFVNNAANNEVQIKAVANSGIELYFNNLKKAETVSAGFTITGTCTATAFSGDGSGLSGVSSEVVDDSSPQLGGNLASNGNNINMADNDEIVIGSSNDLIIRHIPGSRHEILGSASASLQVRCDETIFLSENGNEDLFRAAKDGSFAAYHNGTKRFQTQSFGADIFGQLQIAGHCTPSANNTYDLGTNSERWRNIYTNDLNLSNEGGANDVDSTWGSFTIQEGAEDLFLINKRNNKKYKFNLTEVS